MHLIPFTNTDRAAFTGAEAFRDGSKPLIAHGTFANGHGWVLVLAGTGGLLRLASDPHHRRGGYVLNRPFTSAAQARAYIEQHCPDPGELWDFRSAGFEP